MIIKMMKNIFKYLLFIGALYLMLKVLIPTDLSLSVNDEEYIRKEVFGKDSENRGYSDRAKIMMEEDLNTFKYDAKIKKLYNNFLKQQRLLVLSNSEQEYHDRYVYYHQLRDCIVTLSLKSSPDIGEFKNLLSRNNMESEKMTSFLNNQHARYIKNLSYQTRSKMYNSELDLEGCEKEAQNDIDMPGNALKDKEYIKNHVFAEDSNNRGFSDQANKMMNDDLKEINYEPKISKLYALKLREERKLALVNSQGEYVQSFERIKKLSTCIVNQLLALNKKPKPHFLNFFNTRHNLESDNMRGLLDEKEIKYTKTLSDERINRMLNVFPKPEECKGFINE